MHLINRDESRHIAVDFHMVEYYASDDYQQWLATQPKTTSYDVARGVFEMSSVFYYAGPFFKSVLFEPLERVDPSGRRMREAFKRVQLLAGRPGVRERPFWKTYFLGREVFNDALLGPLLGKHVQRIAGLPDALMTHLYDPGELREAGLRSAEEMANDCLDVKQAS